MVRRKRERRERFPREEDLVQEECSVLTTLVLRMNIGQCTGANNTLNKGVTGLPLRVSAVVGHRGGKREEREGTAFFLGED